MYQTRRELLLEKVQQEYGMECAILLCASVARHNQVFIQDPTFYYYTGVRSAGSVCMIYPDGKQVLYIPQYSEIKKQWVYEQEITEEKAKELGFDALHYAGDMWKTFESHDQFTAREYIRVIEHLQNLGKQNIAIACIQRGGALESAAFGVYEKIVSLSESILDIKNINVSVVSMRRSKDTYEIEMMYQAIAISADAHEAALKAIVPGIHELEVQAAVEYMFTAQQALQAYPSIVGAGKNSTILHYHAFEQNAQMQNDQVVVVDAGALYEGYCADITRTYTTTQFTQRQKDVYAIVLETQELVAQHAKPGMYLMNKDFPEQSLHHIAVKNLEKYGYDKYFPHGIGHFLGMDVHDCGARTDMLQENDVITIEPGIYIPQEDLGIRIEDNYWIVQDGNVCLSEGLPKTIQELEDIKSTF
jgi:Xaa-Pro aminopeptidase